MNMRIGRGIVTCVLCTDEHERKNESKLNEFRFVLRIVFEKTQNLFIPREKSERTQ